jgi:hypothetical protein
MERQRNFPLAFPIEFTQTQRLVRKELCWIEFQICEFFFLHLAKYEAPRSSGVPFFAPCRSALSMGDHNSVHQYLEMQIR